MEHLGNTTANAQQYDEAISLYSTALSLNLPSPQDVLIKRGKAYTEVGSWQRALDDANQVEHFAACTSILLIHHRQVTKLDPSSPWGYELKHAALHKAGDYDNAIRAFEAMLSKIEKSPYPDIRRKLPLSGHGGR